jgi:phage gp36-like protein
MFLIPQDYEQIIRSEILTTLSGGKTYNIDAAEQTARAEMESYLASRYDVARIFVHVEEWQLAGQYLKDAVVWQQGPSSQVVFTAQVAGPGHAPLAPGTDWLPIDPRNALIRTYLVDMAVYHVHAAIPHKAIPELRVIRYEAAISWLLRVSQGGLTPNLPPLPTEPGKNPTDGLLRLGSRPKLRHDR